MTPDTQDDGHAGKALALVNWILEHAIAGVAPLTKPEDLAAEYASNGSYRTRAERITALIRWEAAKNFATGFTTGLGGILTLPVAVPAALGAAWILQARLAGAIAILHGHSLRSDRVRTLILLAIAGDSAKDVAKTAGIVVGKRLTANAIRTVPGRVLIQLNRLIGMRLLTKAGQTGAISLTKAIPIAGGLVGGGFDAATCVAVGRVADRLFGPIEVKATAAKKRPKPARAVRRKTPTAAVKPRTVASPTRKRKTAPRKAVRGRQ
jgi:hypothetical protein